MSLKLYGKTEDGSIDSGWFEPEESRKRRANGWVTDIAELESAKEKEAPADDLPVDDQNDTPNTEEEINNETDVIVKEPTLEELREKAKGIGYRYYKRAKEAKLKKVLKAHHDNQN